MARVQANAMRKIRIDFCDFGFNFSKTNNCLFDLLAERYELELCDQPDFLIHGCFGQSHRLHSGVKILFSGESNLPDFRHCDYSIAPLRLETPRHLLLPWYVNRGAYDVRADPTQIIKRADDHRRILATKNKFCSFIVSDYKKGKNGNRVEFFEKLSKYKKVDSAGRVLNNIGGPIPRGLHDKVDFLRPYKFNIAFENRALTGYTTEKIFDPMLARCLPIYWGDPEINQHFNPGSFLNRADFPSDEALIEKIIELDQDDEKYLEIMRQPYFHGDTPNLFFSQARILDFFEKIFTEKITPAAQAGRKSFFSGRIFSRWKLVKRHHWHPVQPPSWQAKTTCPDREFIANVLGSHLPVLTRLQSQVPSQPSPR